ncbi:F-box protein: endocytic membrane traffic, recycling ReCYcling 1 [Coemansia sp. RSA 988]|nr:F-box protein: endocytic membrane traffic, recycling ReCYcling 1 [Coemansia sp. RSA 988]
MSGYDSDEETKRTVFGGNWLAASGARTLLAKTTKFVLTAAHGSRSLIPTTETGGAENDTVTGVVADSDSDSDDGNNDGDPAQQQQAADECWREVVMTEREVLRGRCNSGTVVSEDAGRVRMRVRRHSQQPARIRTAVGAVAGDRAGRRMVAFTQLPGRVVAGVISWLPVATGLAVINSCRVVRRAVHRAGPGEAERVDATGAQAFTAAGLDVWRALVRRMGWREWQQRARGRERQTHIAVPRSHRQLLAELSGVGTEIAAAALVATEPDVLFKAVYAELNSDYCALGHGAPVVQLALDNDGRVRSAQAVAQRLDQLHWFGQAHFSSDSTQLNRRLATLTERFEQEYERQFRAALATSNCSQTQHISRVLSELHDGRGCVKILVDAHPLFSSDNSSAAYEHVRQASRNVRDPHTFDVFLEALQTVIFEHARVAGHVLALDTQLPAAAVECFVARLFGDDGLARTTLQRLHEHVRTAPVGAEEHGRDAVPDAATRDLLYLSTVASVVGRLLAAADAWTQLKPVGVLRARGRRCVFAAFDDVMSDYVLLERRVLERSYAAELALRADAAVVDRAAEPRFSPDLRQKQMDEYCHRVLRVAEDRLGMRIGDQEATDGQPHSTEEQSRLADAAGFTAGAPRRTVVGTALQNAPISIDLCLNMVLTNRDAVARVAVFAADMQLRGQAQEGVEALFSTLLRSVGAHVRPAFARGVAELQTLEQAAAEGPVESTTEALGTRETTQRGRFAAALQRFGELMQLGDLAVQLVEMYARHPVVSTIVDVDDFLHTCSQERRALERAVDDGVAAGMDCAIDTVLRQTQAILDATQQISDFHPPATRSLTLTPTLACTRAVHFLDETSKVLQSMGRQRPVHHVLMAEVAQRLFALLLAHIRRFRITEPGGFQLIADLNLYYGWAARSCTTDPESLRLFAALKDLANCFILAPADLRGFLRDQYSRHTFDGVMRAEEIYDVVACRADYKDIRGQVEGHCEFM